MDLLLKVVRTFLSKLIAPTLLSHLGLLLHFIPLDLGDFLQTLLLEFSDLPFVVFDGVQFLLLFQLQHTLFNGLVGEYLKDGEYLRVKVEQLVINSLGLHVDAVGVGFLLYSLHFLLKLVSLSVMGEIGGTLGVLGVNELGIEVDSSLLLGFRT